MCSFILVAPNRWRCGEHSRDVWAGSEAPLVPCETLPEAIRFVARNGRFFHKVTGLEIVDPELVERCRAALPRGCGCHH